MMIVINFILREKKRLENWYINCPEKFCTIKVEIVKTHAVTAA